MAAKSVDAFEDSLMAADRLPEPQAPPPVMHFSPGVDVAIFAPTIRPFRQQPHQPPAPSYASVACIKKPRWENSTPA